MDHLRSESRGGDSADERRGALAPWDCNPADCASRGVTPQELLAHPLWWRGPTFLLDTDSWLKDPDLLKQDELPDQRRPY